ncbi:MAG: ferritin-like domain-containing protein [Acidiferrobacter sp.]
MTTAAHPQWSIAAIPYGTIARAQIVDEADWFLLLAAASFVETLSDLYARNLREYYDGDAAACAWLAEVWEREECQHGAALRRYVEGVWPDFDWERGFKGFCADYGPYCQTALLGPTRALEMAARCVVETGTASFYSMLRVMSPEPVLTMIVGHIRDDEVGHYRAFYHFYRQYQQAERVPRWRVGQTLWRRITEVDTEDAYFGVKNAFCARYPGQIFDRATFDRFRARIAVWMQNGYPFSMAAKMVLKPLALPAPVQRVALPLVIHGARRVLGGA